MKIYSRFISVAIVAVLMTIPAITMAGENVSSVNKSIHVDDNSTKGHIDSVNGSIRIGANSLVQSVESVNGAVKLEDAVSVDGHVETVNGSITLQSGCEVGDNIETVNGKILIRNTRVAGNIETINGSMQILDGSEVSGNLVVRKPNGWNNKRRKAVRVVIGENVQIHGDLIFQHPVELKLHDTARVGEIIGDEVTLLDNS